jgi:mannose-1-phosphate guanylyltransferase
MNNPNQGVWGIILATADGKRLQSFGQSCYRLPYPKQYCAFTGFRSMLLHTIDRAQLLIAPEHLLTVVNRAHLAVAESQLAGRPGVRMITEPRNRETGPAILHALLHICRQDPDAQVCLFPSDHFIPEEARFMAYLREAAETVALHPDDLLLLGVQPQFMADGYSWIEKGERVSDGGSVEICRVHRFVEKPDLRRACDLYLAGCLWNTMVGVCSAQALVRLFEKYTPSLVAEFRKIEDFMGTSKEDELLEAMYAQIRSVDFSYEILEKNPEELRVLEVKNVYWSDWGIPERLESDLRTFFPGVNPSTTIATPGTEQVSSSYK